LNSDLDKKSHKNIRVHNKKPMQKEKKNLTLGQLFFPIVPYPKKHKLFYSQNSRIDLAEKSHKNKTILGNKPMQE
jgi:hypothetical protein